MSFTGMSNAGKEAEGWPREYGAWASGQMKGWIPRSDYSTSAGQSAVDWNAAYNHARAADGIGGIATLRDYGSQIMPGVNDYVGNKQDRINQMIADYNSKVPSAQQTMGRVNQSIDETGDLIRQNRDYALGDIANTYDRANAFEDTAHNDMSGAYDKSLADVEMLKPGSQFQQAETARSFAPANATLAGRLRRGGMEMNSPEAIALMQRGDLAQGRAMDEKAAQGTEKYVGARSNLLLGQGGEGVRHAGTMEGIDLNRSNRAVGVQDRTLTRATDWENSRQQAALMDKALNTQDWQTNSDLQRQLSDADLEAINLRQREYGAGMGYQQADLGERNAGAANVGNYGAQQLGYGLQSSQLANQWGNTGMNAYGQAYNYEAPNAGWGVKMLAGAAGAGLNMLAPGSGQILTGAVNSAYPQSGGGGWGGGGYSPYGGGGGYGGGYGGGGTGGWQNLYGAIFKPKTGGGWSGGGSGPWYDNSTNGG